MTSLDALATEYLLSWPIDVNGDPLSWERASRMEVKDCYLASRSFSPGDRVVVNCDMRFRPITVRDMRQVDRQRSRSRVPSQEVTGELLEVIEGGQLFQSEFTSAPILLAGQARDYVAGVLPPSDLDQLDAWADREFQWQSDSVERSLFPKIYADGRISELPVGQLASRAWLLQITAPWVRDFVVDYSHLQRRPWTRKYPPGKFEERAEGFWDPILPLGQNLAVLADAAAAGEFQGIGRREAEFWRNVNKPEPVRPLSTEVQAIVDRVMA